MSDEAGRRRDTPSTPHEEVLLSRISGVEDTLRSIQDGNRRREDKFDRVEEKIDRMDEDNRKSHKETGEILSQIRVVIGEHGMALRHHESRLDGAGRSHDDLVEEVDALANKTGRHEVDIANERVKEEEEKRKAEEAKLKVLEDDRKALINERRKWFLGILAAIVASVLGGAASHFAMKLFHG